MRYNVAQLLQAPTGAERQYTFEVENPDVDEGIDFVAPLQGQVRLLRTGQGVLAQVWVATVLQVACARCLKPVEAPVKIQWSEEYHPTIDIQTGRAISPDPEDAEDGTLIDDHHILDLTEGVRQHLLLHMPSRPLCAEECRGMCPECGANLNTETCSCQSQPMDPRWASLATLLERPGESESA